MDGGKECEALSQSAPFVGRHFIERLALFPSSSRERCEDDEDLRTERGKVGDCDDRDEGGVVDMRQGAAEHRNQIANFRQARPEVRTRLR